MTVIYSSSSGQSSEAKSAPEKKLPLIVRKGLRDTWENKKGDYDEQLSNILGVPWSFTFDPHVIYENCGERTDLHERLGSAISWYVEPFITNVKNWLGMFGEESKKEINSLGYSHVVEIRPQETTKFTYGGIEFKDGILRLVFAENNFVVNVDEVSSPDALTEAVKTAAKAEVPGASKGPLNLEAKRDIRDNWEAQYQPIREKISKLVAIPDIQLIPNFEENATKLATLESSRDADVHQAQIGHATRTYFEALQSNLEYQKFGEDDMMQEAFQEAVTSKTIGLRIVDQCSKSPYSETTITDGMMWIDVPLENWWVNVDRCGEGIQELL